MKRIEQFQCKKCGARTTLRSRTVVESSNLSYRDCFFAFHLMTATKKDLSAKEMQRKLELKRYEPVWYMIKKIRVAMGAWHERYELTGFTEIDDGYVKTIESAIFGEKNGKLKRGRGSIKQTPVLVKKHNFKVLPPKETGEELPWVHIAICNAKRNFLNNFHHVDDTYWQNYCDEFTYRLHSRYFGEIF